MKQTAQPRGVRGKRGRTKQNMLRAVKFWTGRSLPVVRTSRTDIKGTRLRDPLEMRDVVSGAVMRGYHHGTRHITPIHYILSTAPQLSISQKALGTLPEDENIMPKNVGATIHN
jgi:hypothetical protein